MTSYKSGETVKKGFYASTARWAIEMIEHNGGVLPGENETYRRLPVPVLLIAAPFMGLGFAMFLPLIGFVMVGRFAWHKLTGRRTTKATGRRVA